MATLIKVSGEIQNNMAQCFLGWDCFSEGSEHVPCRWFSFKFGFCSTPRNDSSCEKKCCYVVWYLHSTFETLWRNPQFSLFRFPNSITVLPYVQFFVHPLPFVLRRIDRPLYQLLPDCAAGWWVYHLFYNHFTPSELLRELKIKLVLQNQKNLESFQNQTVVTTLHG